MISSNDEFHRISELVKQDVGELDPSRIYYEWEDWLKKNIRGMKISSLNKRGL